MEPVPSIAALWVAVVILSSQTDGYIPKSRLPDYYTDGFPKIMFMSTVQMIRSRGYPVEVHEVKTTDGYLLTVHRIPGGRNGTSGKGLGTPVLMGHGLASSNEQWLIRDKDNMVFFLADEGFDVWLGTYRGSIHGRRHVTLTTNSQKFWDFSWHENGVYDQTAMIDYILAATNRSRIFTVGHSMGSTVQAVLLAERPDYSKKLLANVLMAPPVYYFYPEGVMYLLAILYQTLPYLRVVYSTYVTNDLFYPMSMAIFPGCYPSSEWKAPLPVCEYGMKVGAGSPQQPVDRDLQRSFSSHFPSGASIRQAMHYAQIVTTDGAFRKFDYGPVKNYKLYGSARPPPYNMSRISSPVYVYYGHTDNLASYKDSEKLAKDIPTLQDLYKVPRQEYNHVDFLIARDNKELINERLLRDFVRHL